MFEQIANYEGIKDISKATLENPIFNVKMIFEDLLYMVYTADIEKELPRITLKLITILLEKQSKYAKTLREAIETYNSIVMVSLLISGINMCISIGHLVYELYKGYCTKETRTRRHQPRIRNLLQDLGRELRNIRPPENEELRDLERRLEEI